jgi:hypothetical protein
MKAWNCSGAAALDLAPLTGKREKWSAASIQVHVDSTGFMHSPDDRLFGLLGLMASTMISIDADSSSH